MAAAKQHIVEHIHVNQLAKIKRAFQLADAALANHVIQPVGRCPDPRVCQHAVAGIREALTIISDVEHPQ